MMGHELLVSQKLNAGVRDEDFAGSYAGVRTYASEGLVKSEGYSSGSGKCGLEFERHNLYLEDTSQVFSVFGDESFGNPWKRKGEFHVFLWENHYLTEY
jgi:hypothetical protein